MALFFSFAKNSGIFREYLPSGRYGQKLYKINVRLFCTGGAAWQPLFKLRRNTMKKCISVLVLLALLAGGAFAADFGLSAGGGALFDMSLNNGVKVDSDGMKGSLGHNNTSFGGFIFFDATYVEVDIGFAYGILKPYAKDDAKDLKDDKDTTAMQLNFALLGKYPIEVGSFTIFPLLGVSYNFVLSAKRDGKTLKNAKDEEIAKDLSQFGILGGIGADFGLTDSLYLRAEALFQLRLASKYQNDTKKGLEDMGAKGGKPTLGVGPVIKVALGYKF